MVTAWLMHIKHWFTWSPVIRQSTTVSPEHNVYLLLTLFSGYIKPNNVQIMYVISVELTGFMFSIWSCPSLHFQSTIYYMYDICWKVLYKQRLHFCCCFVVTVHTIPLQNNGQCSQQWVIGGSEGQYHCTLKLLWLKVCMLHGPETAVCFFFLYVALGHKSI